MRQSICLHTKTTKSEKAMDEKKPTSKKNIIIAAIVALVVIIAGCGIGFAVWNSGKADRDKAACAAASDEMRVAANWLHDLVNGDADAAAQLTEEDVTDADVLTDFQKAYKEATTEPELVTCVENPGDQVAKMKENTQWYKDQLAALKKATEAVQAVEK